MVTWKSAAPLLWKMIDIYQKESNNSTHLLEEMEVTPANVQVHGNLFKAARGSITRLEQKLSHSRLILIQINLDEKGPMASVSAPRGVCVHRKRSVWASHSPSTALPAKVRVSQYVNSRVTEKKKGLSLFCIQKG